MTDQTHGHGEDIAGLAEQVLAIAERAFTLGAEVAVVKIQIGAETPDPWALAFAVADRIGGSGRPYVCRAFARGDRPPPGENVTGHYEIRRKT